MLSQAIHDVVSLAIASIPNLPPVNSTENAWDGKVKRIVESAGRRADVRELLVKLLREHANPLCCIGEAMEHVKWLVDASGRLSFSKCFSGHLLDECMSSILDIVAGTVQLARVDWCFKVTSKRIPKNIGADPCQPMQGSGKRSGQPLEHLPLWRLRNCNSYDSALAWLCLVEEVLQAPDKSGVFWCWMFCKTFVKLCEEKGGHATVQDMVHDKFSLPKPGKAVKITLPGFWKELKDEWREPVKLTVIVFLTQRWADACCMALTSEISLPKFIS